MPPPHSLVEKVRLSAHVPRLSSDGDPLYLRLDPDELRRSGLVHGQSISAVLPTGATIYGVVKTSGTSPWLAPGDAGSNAAISESLISAGLAHGQDIHIDVVPL